MKSFRFLFSFAMAVATVQLSAWPYVDAYFTEIPTSVDAGQAYWVAGQAYSDYGADVSLWKNSNYLNSSSGYPWASTGSWTADSAAGTSQFVTSGWDWEWGTSDNDVRNVTINAVVTNQNPIATVEVDGYFNGANALRPYGGGVTVTVRYKATDADGNLSGIRPQVWSPDGALNNNGGNFVAQSGASGEVVWSVNLNQSGNWYFWTDATDSTISPNYVDSGAWGNGFRINVIQDAQPAQAPTVFLNQPSANTTINVGTALTLQSYAEDFTRPLVTHNLEIQRPDGAWNTGGSFANSSTYLGGPVGPDAPTASTRAAGFTFDRKGTWQVRAYAANSANLSSHSATRTVTVLALAQATASISPTSGVINAGGSVTFTAGGGSGTGAYQWGGSASGTGSSKTVQFPSAGTYSVTVYRLGDNTYADSNTATATVTVNAVQGSVAISPANPSIVTGSSVTFTASGGNGTGAYTWGGDASGTGASKTVTFPTAGTRSVTVYRAASTGFAQSSTAAASITVTTPPVTSSEHPKSQTAVTGSNVTFSAPAAGSGTVTYQWLKNGTAIQNETNATLTLSNVQFADSAGYSVIVTNNGTSTTSSTAWLPIVDATGGGTNARMPQGKDLSPIAPGMISTLAGGSGYDIQTGSVRRTVRDFQVAGSVGAYPLEMTRIYTSKGGWSYSFVWTAEELADPDFVTSPTLNPVENHRQYLNVCTPDGQQLQFIANEPLGGTWASEFFQSNDGTRVGIVRHPTTRRVDAIALHFPDGGSLMMEKCVDSGGVRKFRASRLTDPFGLITTFTYNEANSQVPYRVTDATGRYLQFTTTGTIESVTRVDSSDEKWIQWASGTLNYWDGTSASYSGGFIPANADANTAEWRYTRFSDVRAASGMRDVEYIERKIAYGATGNLATFPPEPAVWEVVRERHFTAGTAVDAGTLVSTRSVVTRSQFIEDVGERATGPATEVKEIRGDGAERTFKFGSGGGRMISATNFRGQTSYFRNWYTDVPWEIEDARGNKTNIETNSWSRILKITHPLTEVGAFLETGESAQTVRDERQYAWSGRFLTGERDERGNWTYYDRDAQNRIWRIRYADGSNEEFAYNSLNQVSQHKLRNGAYEYWDYYSDTKLPYRHWPATSNAKSTSEPYFEYTYHSSGPQKGLLQTSRDPGEHVTTYAYFASGRLQTETFADNSTRSYTYDNWGNRLTVTDELNKTTTSTYDAYNRLLTVTDPNNDVTTHSYTPSRNDELSSLVHVAAVVRRTTLPSLRKTAFKHDNDYHVTEEIRGEGSAEEAKSFTQFDAVGNPTKRTEQVKFENNVMQTRVTDYIYDARNRKREEQAPLFRTIKWDYDSASNVAKVTNADATFTTKTYNAMNQVATSSDEMGDTTSYIYYPSGLVHTITDPRSKVYTHTYDAVGRIKTRTYPDSLATQEKWDYDAAGNVEFYYNRSSQKQTFVYNNRHRETSRTWETSAATPAVSTTYYANGLVWTRSNGISTLTNTYHDDGALHTQQQAIVSGPSNTITLTYDDDGRRETFNGGTDRDLGYRYNARGGLGHVRLDGVNGTDLASYIYNLAEQRETRTAGNGVVTDHGYDAAGRLNLLNTAGVLQLDFGHDLRDRRKWTKRDGAYGDTYSYHADSELDVYRHQILNPDDPGTNQPVYATAFQFDDSGNRTSVQRTGQGALSTLYAAGNDNRYDTVNVNGASAPIAHDARGNVTTWDGKTFTYDADNRLRSVTGTELTMTMDYDGNGRLVKLVKNGTVEYRFYDGAQCFLRTDGNGTALDWTVWGPTPDEVIARNVSGAWQYYHQDQINSVFAVTNVSGTVLERYLYDPFGLPDVRNASGQELLSTAIGNPWLFTGQEWRGDLGLSNYKARWYQPTLGRFLQNDPVRFDAGDINLYRYCGNDPVNRMDPTGMVWDPDTGFWGAAQYAEFGKGMAADSINTFNEGAAHMEAGFQNIADGNYAEGALNVVAAVGKAAEMGLDVAGGKGTSKAVGMIEKGAHAAVEKGGALARVAFRGGESPAAAAGRNAHKTWDAGEGFKKEVTLPSGKRADAVNVEQKHVKELKPDNPRAIQRGEKQVEIYRKELEKEYGGTWTSSVETYKR